MNKNAAQQYCFVIVKEIAGGGTTSGILYKLFPKVIITARGLDSYTTCHLHKYGWPNNTSAMSRGATSQNTSSANGRGAPSPLDPLDLGGGNNGTGIYINDILPFVISIVWF